MNILKMNRFVLRASMTSFALLAVGGCAPDDGAVADASGEEIATTDEAALTFEPGPSVSVAGHTVNVGPSNGTDDFLALQGAIDKCKALDPCTVALQKDEHYIIDPKDPLPFPENFASSKCTDPDKLVVKRVTGLAVESRSNVTILGNGATITNKSPYFDTRWGDMFVVAHAKNVRVEKLTLESLDPAQMDAAFWSARRDYDAKLEKNKADSAACAGTDQPVTAAPSYNSRNCFSVVDSTGIVADHVICKNAPQTSFGAVGGAAPKPRVQLTLQNVAAVNSGKHAYRFHGRVAITMDHSSSTHVRFAEDATKFQFVANGPEVMLPASPSSSELAGQRVHVWYRDALEDSSVTITNSHFDATAVVAQTVGGGSGADGLHLTENVILGGLYVRTPQTSVKTCSGQLCTAEVYLVSNVFDCSRRVVPAYPAAVFMSGPGLLSHVTGNNRTSSDGTRVPATCIVRSKG
jgi:hypothetical protein